MIHLRLGIAFYRIATTCNESVIAADQEFVCRHMDRLLRQDYIMGSRSFIQIDGLHAARCRPGYR